MPLQEIATAEGKKAALEMGARAVREEHEDLQRELETVQLSVEAAKADVATAQRELRTLRDKVRPPHNRQAHGMSLSLHLYMATA